MQLSYHEMYTCLLNMMLLLHDLGYIDEHDIGPSCYISEWLLLMLF